MKKTIILILLFSFGIFLSCDAQKSECPFDISADLVSSFIWRGSKMGNGPAIQPTLEFAKGGLAIGAWGSYYFSDSDAAETDLYAGYSFDSGLNIGVNDYYFPATSFFKVNNHAIELNGAFQAGNFNFSANYVINEGAGSPVVTPILKWVIKQEMSTCSQGQEMAGTHPITGLQSAISASQLQKRLK